jgi:hypothetical protein
MALLPRESSLLRRFLRSSRLRPHILPVHLHDVIGDEDRLCLSLARSQRLEIGSGIGPQNSRLAIEHCAIDRQGRYGISNAGEGVAVARRDKGPQADAVALPRAGGTVLGSRREGAARRRHGDMVRARWQMAAPRARGSIARSGRETRQSILIASLIGCGSDCESRRDARAAGETSGVHCLLSMRRCT